MNLSRQDFDWAAQQQLITPEQAAALWQAFNERQPDSMSRTHFDFANVAYYTGALIVIAAMGWFLTETWALFGGPGMIGIALIYALIFGLLGYRLWSQAAFRVPGGLLFTLMVCMTPLAIYGLLITLDLNQTSRHYWGDELSSFWMALATIISGSLTLYFIRFPFLTAPIAFALWYLAIEAVPFFLGTVEFSWDEMRRLSMFFGLIMILVAYFIDQRTKEDFAFWLYLFGLLAFWVSLTLINSESEWARFLYFLLNASLMIISVLLQRRIFILFGSIGILLYLGHLSYQVFAGSMLFPIILSLTGIFVIFLGVQYQRHRQAIEHRILTLIPAPLRTLLPMQRQTN